MSNPGELTLESFARNLYNDEAKRAPYPQIWTEIGSEGRRKYRKQAWMLYVENVEQSKVGIYNGTGDRQKDL